MKVLLSFLLCLLLNSCCFAVDVSSSENFLPKELSPEILMYALPVGLVGFIFLVFGSRLLKPVLFLSGLSIGVLIALSVLANVGEAQEFGSSRTLVYALSSVTAGAALGLLFLAVWRLGLLAIGGLGGFSLAMFALSFPFVSQHLVLDESSTTLIRPVFVIGMCGLGAISTLFFERLVIIVSTSLFGSGLLCCAIDMVADTGFKESIQRSLQNSNDIAPWSGTMLGLVVSYFILVAIGLFVQLNHHPERNLSSALCSESGGSSKA